MQPRPAPIRRSLIRTFCENQTILFAKTTLKLHPPKVETISTDIVPYTSARNVSSDVFEKTLSNILFFLLDRPEQYRKTRKNGLEGEKKPLSSRKLKITFRGLLKTVVLSYKKQLKNTRKPTNSKSNFRFSTT